MSERMQSLVTDLNVCSNKGLGERFDSTIGAATVLMPYGGKNQLTPAQAMVSKFPVEGETTTASAMAWGFNPYLSEKNQFKGAYLAVVESVARLVATGFTRDAAYLSFQEYFERLRNEPARWGKPAASVLGALMAQVDLKIGAIGGKDSMSGSFEDLDVLRRSLALLFLRARSIALCLPSLRRRAAVCFVLLRASMMRIRSFPMSRA